MPDNHFGFVACNKYYKRCLCKLYAHSVTLIILEFWEASDYYLYYYCPNVMDVCLYFGNVLPWYTSIITIIFVIYVHVRFDNSYKIDCYIKFNVSSLQYKLYIIRKILLKAIKNNLYLIPSTQCSNHSIFCVWFYFDNTIQNFTIIHLNHKCHVKIEVQFRYSYIVEIVMFLSTVVHLKSIIHLICSFRFCVKILK